MGLNLQTINSTYIQLLTISYISVQLSLLWFTNSITKLRSLGCVYIILILLTIDFIKSKYSTGNTQRFTPKIEYKKLTNVILSSILFYFTVAILYGAPFLTHHEETLMFALLMTACTTCHSLIHLGVKGSADVLFNLDVFTSGVTRHDLVLRNVQFSLVGAWGFSFFIPLDWDRLWQEWPIPCCVGVLVGHMFGHLVSVFLMVFTRFCKRKKLYV